MIGITGANGHLGRLVIEQLLAQIPAAQIVAVVRSPEKAADLAGKGVQVRFGDYNEPQSLDAAFAGLSKLLFISSSDVGRRGPQHKAVIEAAKRSGVQLVAYTSLLHADTSPLPLAAEHRETEVMLKESGLPHVLLRNGWYTENYLGSLSAVLEHGVMYGCAGNGKVSSASRADYARAATVVLTNDGHAGKTYELGGDHSFTLAEFASEVARQSRLPVRYQNLPEDEFQAVLVKAGLPAFLATLIAESETGASKGGLFDDSKDLSKLTGHPTTPLATMVDASLA
ncbi:SDR family oxidoreductase [Massilia sp. IC2-477]|uniref:SDR family oxidoreductase n=1 Tax=Massilia sp. IC2-477 TaxID=2887198 RepID=UPI001D115FCC|nr:SDR family oxidoreductase [Massilia sp. IC2-477]MCC2954344.1 SDR family oxidoreductase [Massilia sp. IC2-477]